MVDGGKAFAGLGDDGWRAVAVLDVRSMGDKAEKIAVRAGQDMPLPPTVVNGGKSLGSIAHWQPVAAMYWIASQTARISVRRGRPTFEAGGMYGATRAHSSSVVSLAYR